ncbi:MAG: SPOR domain-containing protein [Candidatus Marinimicrobia bacterium]|jgi:cell division septation protein DedD|nr:SPOR domain-containing protein [Candidatus Neomarinimicrobiota bacterium]
MAKIITIFTIFTLLVITGCGKSNPTATVGDYITVNAEIPEESQDLDFIWELTNIPNGSELDNSQLTSGEFNASVMFIPDVSGPYSIEVSVFQYNDEISTQSFSYDVIDRESSREVEQTIEDEYPKEAHEAVAELMVNDDEPKWYESESVAQVVEEASQEMPEPIVDVVEPKPIVEKKPDPIPPPPPSKKKKMAKPKPNTRGMSIPFDKERFTIQVASKKVLEDAKNVAATLIDAGYDAYIQKADFKETNEIWYRVRVGSYDNRDTAVAVAESLSKTRSEKAWVDFVRYEF